MKEKNDGIENPFRHNYLFSKFDLNRCRIKKWQYPLLFLLPTYASCHDGIAFFFKRFNGKIYLMRTEDL